MIKEILHCDQCLKSSTDICGDIDWIKFESQCPIRFSVSNRRPNSQTDPTHRYRICKGYGPEIKMLNFCSTQCMLAWMGLIKKDEIKEHVRKDINELIEEKCLSRDNEATYEVTINTIPEKTMITKIQKVR